MAIYFDAFWFSGLVYLVLHTDFCHFWRSIIEDTKMKGGDIYNLFNKNLSAFSSFFCVFIDLFCGLVFLFTCD